MRENWHKLIQTVQSLSTKYGQERVENIIGTVSQSEARDALRQHGGNIWQAVSECIEQRQRKYRDISSKGNYSREDIVTALTIHQGNANLALLDLGRTQLKPFLMRIRGSPAGVENESGANFFDDNLAEHTIQPEIHEFLSANASECYLTPNTAGAAFITDHPTLSHESSTNEFRNTMYDNIYRHSPYSREASSSRFHLDDPALNNQNILKDLETLIGNIEQNQAKQKEPMLKTMESMLANSLGKSEMDSENDPEMMRILMKSPITTKHAKRMPSDSNSRSQSQLAVKNFVWQHIQEIVPNLVQQVELELMEEDTMEINGVKEMPLEQKVTPPEPPPINAEEFILEEIIGPNIKEASMRELVPPEFIYAAEIATFRMEFDRTLYREYENEFAFNSLEDADRSIYKMYQAPDVTKVTLEVEIVPEIIGIETETNKIAEESIVGDESLTQEVNEPVTDIENTETNQKRTVNETEAAAQAKNMENGEETETVIEVTQLSTDETEETIYEIVELRNEPEVVATEEASTILTVGENSEVPRPNTNIAPVETQPTTNMAVTQNKLIEEAASVTTGVSAITMLGTIALQKMELPTMASSAETTKFSRHEKMQKCQRKSRLAKNTNNSDTRTTAAIRRNDSINRKERKNACTQQENQNQDIKTGSLQKNDEAISYSQNPDSPDDQPTDMNKPLTVDNTETKQQVLNTKERQPRMSRIPVRHSASRLSGEQIIKHPNQLTIIQASNKLTTENEVQATNTDRPTLEPVVILNQADGEAGKITMILGNVAVIGTAVGVENQINNNTESLSKISEERNTHMIGGVKEHSSQLITETITQEETRSVENSPHPQMETVKAEKPLLIQISSTTQPLLVYKNLNQQISAETPGNTNYGNQHNQFESETSSEEDRVQTGTETEPKGQNTEDKEEISEQEPNTTRFEDNAEEIINQAGEKSFPMLMSELEFGSQELQSQDKDDTLQETADETSQANEEEKFAKLTVKETGQVEINSEEIVHQVMEESSLLVSVEENTQVETREKFNRTVKEIPAAMHGETTNQLDIVGESSAQITSDKMTQEDTILNPHVEDSSNQLTPRAIAQPESNMDVQDNESPTDEVFQDAAELSADEEVDNNTSRPPSKLENHDDNETSDAELYSIESEFSSRGQSRSVTSENDVLLAVENAPEMSIQQSTSDTAIDANLRKTSRQNPTLEFVLSPDASKQNLSELVEDTQRLIKQMKEEINIEDFESSEEEYTDEYTDEDEYDDDDEDDEDWEGSLEEEDTEYDEDSPIEDDIDEEDYFNEEDEDGLIAEEEDGIIKEEISAKDNTTEITDKVPTVTASGGEHGSDHENESISAAITNTENIIIPPSSHTKIIITADTPNSNIIDIHHEVANNALLTKLENEIVPNSNANAKPIVSSTNEIETENQTAELPVESVLLTDKTKAIIAERSGNDAKMDMTSTKVLVESEEQIETIPVQTQESEHQIISAETNTVDNVTHVLNQNASKDPEEPNTNKVLESKPTTGPKTSVISKIPQIRSDASEASTSKIARNVLSNSRNNKLTSPKNNVSAVKPQTNKPKPKESKIPKQTARKVPLRSKSFSGPPGPIGISSVKTIQQEFLNRQKILTTRYEQPKNPPNIVRKKSITEAITKFIPSTSAGASSSTATAVTNIFRTHPRIPKKKYHETCFSDDDFEMTTSEEELEPLEIRQRKQSMPVFRAYPSVQEPEVVPSEVSRFC